MSNHALWSGDCITIVLDKVTHTAWRLKNQRVYVTFQEDLELELEIFFDYQNYVQLPMKKAKEFLQALSLYWETKTKQD